MLQVNDFEPYEGSVSAIEENRTGKRFDPIRVATEKIRQLAKKELLHAYQAAVPFVRAGLQRKAAEISEISKVKLKSLEESALTYAKANPFRAMGIVFVGAILVRRFLTR